MDPRYERKRFSALAACLLACLLGVGCAGVTQGPLRYSYFTQPDPGDQWSPKIAGWQRRERAVDPAPVLAPAPVSEPAPTVPEPQPSLLYASEPEIAEVGQDLRAKYFAFRMEQKRAAARSVAAWTQTSDLSAGR